MDTRLPFNVFSVRFAFLSSPCILVLGFFLSGFWAGKSVEVTCRTHVLVNMSHIAKADGIRYQVFSFTSFQQGGSLEVYFAACFRYVALAIIQANL